MELKWNVFISDFNRRKIITYNIFDHYKFKEECDEVWKKYKTDFPKCSEVVKRNLMYYFWSKCEWEVIIRHWPPSDRHEDKKIDVYEQVMQNWNVFIIYLWNYYYLKSTRKENIKSNLHVTEIKKHVSNIDLDEEYEDL